MAEESGTTSTTPREGTGPSRMNQWIEEIVAEMIEAGLVEEVEPGVVQKLGGHGYKLDYSAFEAKVDVSEIPRDEFKIMLLAIMEAPQTMGSPVERPD